MSDLLVTAVRGVNTLLQKQSITDPVLTQSVAVPDETQAVIVADIDAIDGADPSKLARVLVQVADSQELSWETIADYSWQGYAADPWKGASRNPSTTIDLAPYKGLRLRVSLQSDSGCSSGLLMDVK